MTKSKSFVFLNNNEFQLQGNIAKCALNDTLAGQIWMAKEGYLRPMMPISPSICCMPKQYTPPRIEKHLLNAIDRILKLDQI